MNALVNQKNNQGLSAVGVTPYVASPGLLLLCLLVLLMVVGSALGVIYSSYKSRQLFGELQHKNKVAMQLEEQWGRLLLEQSTWASHGRIEKIAKDKLQMIVPDPSMIVVLQQ